MTRFEKIKHYNIAEMADLVLTLSTQSECDICVFNNGDDWCEHYGVKCRKGMEEWLRQEVEQ